MKPNSVISAALILVTISLMAFKIAGDTIPIGADLPKATLALKDITGKAVTMKELKKTNGLLVMFTCNTCPYVIKNQQRTKEICKYSLQNNIGVILLNSNEGQRADDDSFEAMQNYAKRQGYEWHYAVDKDNVIADEFGAKRTPECYLFDKQLKLSYHGAIDDNPGDEKSVNHHYLQEAIDGVVKGKEIAVKETRSVGCGIKRKG